MIEVSQKFKELMKAPVKVVRARIVFDNGTTVSAEDNLVSITLEATGQYFLSAARTGKAVLLGSDWGILYGQRMTVYLTAYASPEDETGEEACYGVFVVRTQSSDLEKGMTTIEFDGSLTRTTNTLYNTAVLVFPMTVAELATAVANQGHLNLITDMTTLPNYDYVITEDLWKTINNTSFRDVIDQIAGATATIARVGGAENNLEFVPVNEAPVDNIGYENLRKFKFGDKYGKVSSVVLARTPQEDNVVVVDEATEKSASGLNLVRYSDSFRAGNSATGITPTVEEDGTLKVVVTSGNGNWHTAWWDGRLSTSEIENMFKEGDKFTISFTIKKESGATGKPNIYIKNGMGYYPMVGNVGEEYSEIYYTGKWKKANGMAMHLGWSACVGTFYIKNFMIKKGSYAPYEPFKENGIVEVKLANNEILDDDRESLATPILNAAKGLEYRATELLTEGHGWYEIGDKIDLYENEVPQLPPEYQELNYIEGTGTQYIDSGYRATPLTRTLVEYEWTNVETKQQRIFGWQAGDGLWYSHYINGGSSPAFAFLDDNGNWQSGGGVFEEGKKYKFDLDGKGKIAIAYKDDGTVRWTKDMSSFTATKTTAGTIKILANYQDGRVQQFAKAKLYTLKMWENGELVRDFVPCYRKSDNVAGLYDKANGVFYTNSGMNPMQSATRREEISVLSSKATRFSRP